MKRAKTQEEKYRQMTEMPVSRLIPGLAVPTIISMLISSVYNMADTFFVSQLGTSASGAVGVIFSAMAIIQAIGFGFGQGAGIFISQSLGNRNTEKAGEAAAASFFAVMLIGILIGVFGNLFLHPLVMLLGATPTIAPYAEDYAMYILIASPFMMCSFVMNNILRSQGNAVYAMVGITAGSSVYLHIRNGDGRRRPGYRFKPVYQFLHSAVSVQSSGGLYFHPLFQL